MENRESEFHYGIVKVYYPLKGFGFITQTKGRDIFFLRSEFSEEALIFEGNSVKFKIEKGSKGLRATQITRSG